MKSKILFIALYIVMYNASFGQTILDQYIQEGFQHNKSIQQQQFALEKSVYALKEARALFLPNVSFMTDYFLAAGGRTVDFPAGDLLNPVYSSLNQLTNSSNFPQLENQSILLNPNNFYDAKFRTTLPLLNLEIEYNKRIKREQVAMQKVEIDLYKRELAKEIKVAYFKYLQSVESIKIYEMALVLVRESKRINESLFKNDKVNRTLVLRAENEITKFEAIRENAIQNSNSAKAYFNFLLNRNLTDSISVESNYQNAATFFGDSTSISQREELQKLQTGNKINQHLLGLSKSYIVPKLSTFLDLGSQGFDWQFDNKSRYYFFGVSLQWDLFTSGRNNYKVKQAELNNKIIQSQTDYVETQLQLQFTTMVNNFTASLFSYQAAVSAFTTAQKFHNDMLRLYKEGQALFIELLDAQNQFIQAELQVNISLYDTYIKAAEIERANASFNLNNN
jgi:outer membrane protein TolC